METNVCIAPSQIQGAGQGLFATADFQKGDLVAVLSGPILTQEQASDGRERTYMVALSSKKIIDTKTSQCFGKYVNDAQGSGFRNNLRMAPDHRNQRVNLRATRYIQAGEELFLDYGYKL